LGLSVVLIEQAKFPRDRVGETLHPGVEPILRQLGVWERVEAAGFLRHEGIRIDLHGAPTFVSYGREADGRAWRGLQVWRATFDTILLTRAQELGAEVRQPCRAIEPIVCDGDVQGVVTSAGLVRARVTIDACGGRHWLARRISVPIRRHSEPLTVGYGYAIGHCQELDDAPALTKGIGAVAWEWSARVSPDVYAWSRLLKSSEMHSSRHFTELPKPLHALQPMGSPRGEDVTWRTITIPAGSGYFIAGDAAGVLDPGSAHGVLRAMMGGIFAAHLSASVIKLPRSAAATATTYTEWLGKSFAHDMSMLRAMYGPAFQAGVSRRRER
jgi:flavin-dependent dehydrogenase